MSLRKYCTEQDRANELRAMEAVCQKLRLTQPGHTWAFQQCSDESPYDGILLRDGKAHGILEVRGRKGDPAKYDEWQTRKAKIDKLVRIASQKGLVFVLVCTWDDKVFMGLPARVFNTWKTRMGGRIDRGDPSDWEPMYLMPRNHFEAV